MAWFRKKKDSDDKKKNGKPEKKENGAKKRLLAFKAAEHFAAAEDQTKIAKRKLESSTPQPEKLKKKPKTAVPEPPPAAHAEPMRYERPRDLPDGYGDNQIYLMVRDPYWLYSYWEIQKDHQEKTLKQLGGSWDGVSSILRVYDVTDKKNSSHFDIALQGMAKAWYINVQPNRSYVVEIGLLDRHGRFAVLARSNEITTPRAGMSDVIDERWMGIDFDKMYALSGGFQVGKSSAELQKLMEERLVGAISSGSGAGLISSLSSPVKIKKRGFWFILDCELIVYGATEPDARVTLQGREIKLRPDGTFSLRFALPDGKYVLDAHAYSADGIEERIIVPIVERRTERPAPILKPTS